MVRKTRFDTTMSWKSFLIAQSGSLASPGNVHTVEVVEVRLH